MYGPIQIKSQKSFIKILSVEPLSKTASAQMITGIIVYTHYLNIHQLNKSL